MSDTTILVVDDDTVLSQVLRRVLSRQGYHLLEAGTVADALRLARERRPDLGLVDLCLPDGDGVELARALQGEGMAIPLVLMTAYPLRLRDQPELAHGFARVLTKPLNLEELRHTLEEVLAEAAAGHAPGLAAPPSTVVPSERSPELVLPNSAPGVVEPAAPAGLVAAPASPTPGSRRKALWAGLGVGLAAALIILTFWPPPGVPSWLDWLKGHAHGGEPEKPPPLGVPVAGDPKAMELPADVVEHLLGRNPKQWAMRISDEVAKRPLVLSGSLAFDPTRLYRVQARFPGEVIKLGTTPDRTPAGTTALPRRLNIGDRVAKGDVMAVVLSKDLGQAKSALVDALVKLHVDEENLEKMRPLAMQGFTPEVAYRNLRAQVFSDRNAVNAAELTLRTWQLTDTEIDPLKEEARRVQSLNVRRDTAKELEWAKVEVKAPGDGVIVEMNVNLHNMVDTSFDLYKVADLSKLGVLLNAYEEELRPLEKLGRGYAWELRVSADPLQPPLKNDGIERLGAIVDPNQHTTPVMGRVHNPQESLKVGQFVTAKVEMDPPAGVVSIPASALDEDGDESIVFVQPDPTKLHFRLRRVTVAGRLGETVYVRRELTEAQKAAGLEALVPGDVVVTRGVVELKSTYEDMRANIKK